MKALVLAAGYATRLYPLTREYPKPLLHVGKRSIIDYIIEKLARLDEIDEIIVVTNSKFISRFRGWAKRLKIRKRLTLVDDLTKGLTDRRGAIGDMQFAIKKKRVKEDLLVIGGDNLFDGSLKKFLRFAKANRPYPVIGVYDIKNKEKAKKYGVVKVDKENKVIDFKEKPKVPISSLVAMCLYYFPKEDLKLIEEYLGRKKEKYDATGLYIDWLRKRLPVYAFVFGGRWYDIGDFNFYNEAIEKFNEDETCGAKRT